MPKVGLLIFPFWTAHFVTWTSDFGWNLESMLKLYWLVYSLSSQLLHSLSAALLSFHCLLAQLPVQLQLIGRQLGIAQWWVWCRRACTCSRWTVAIAAWPMQ